MPGRRELRKLRPGLQVDWLAQDPVTRLLETNGERVHPLSARLALFVITRSRFVLSDTSSEGYVDLLSATALGFSVGTTARNT